MKTILLNFLSIFRRFKMATTLNILGLSIAFAAFMIIIMQVDYDYNFDRKHKYASTIYKVEVISGSTIAVIPRPIADVIINSSPHIVAGSLASIMGDQQFETESNGIRNNFTETIRKVYPDFTNVFEFEMIEGDVNALSDPGKALIPESVARKIFANESAINKPLKSDDFNLTIGGVYKDFPKNSSVRNIIYIAIPKDENLYGWGNASYEFYIRVDAPENSVGLIENFKNNFDPLQSGGASGTWISGFDYQLTALPDVHFSTVEYDTTPKSSRQTMLVLLAIAFIIVAIAGINFTNFSTAIIPMRIKSINTQKVLGNKDSTLRLSLLVEAISICLLSYLLAILWVYLIRFTLVSSLVDADISLRTHPLIVGSTALMALLTGVFAGLYPSYYITSFPPALVLKGNFGLSPKGRKLRNVLVGVQFIASFALIIGASFMYLQNRYMQKSSLGYGKDELIVTNLNDRIITSKEAFINQAKSFSGIEGVTFAHELLSSQDQYNEWGQDYQGEQIQFQFFTVDPAFLDVIGVKVEDGRNFRKEDELTVKGALILNETARRQFDLEIGEKLGEIDIIGFVPDVKFASLRTAVTPMAFYVWGTDNWGIKPQYAYIKVNAETDKINAMEHVKETLKSFDPEHSFNIRFYDNVLENSYAQEKKLSFMITLFSLIAVFLSIVGIFGLVMFDSEYRRKEIGVRKVLGSTTKEILLLFNKTYVRILCLCFVLAGPVGYFAISRWLENFAYKTPIHWWVFLVSFIGVSIITISTVTFQNWWVANSNPVDSIKAE